jgi:hypothetical protein
MLIRVLLFVTAAVALTAADFTYVDRTEITGGTMKSIMNMAARFSKKAGQPVQTTHHYSGKKNAAVTEDSVTVTDLSAETITALDKGKNECSTITFAEMAEAMKKMGERMAGMKKQEGADMKWNWKVSAENTGKSKIVADTTARHTMVKLTTEATGARSGQTMTTAIAMDIYTGKAAGYEAVKEFNMELGKKMASGMGMDPAMMAQMGAAFGDGMKEAGKALAKIDGMPMETVMRMGSGDVKAASEAPLPAGGDSQEAPQVSKGDAAGAAVGSALGRIGGFGRFGRKKKEEQPPPPQPQAQQTPPAAAAGSVMLETTTQVLSHNTNSVDIAGLIPANCKRVEHPMKKALR